MADAGRILIIAKGNYNPNTAYETLDLVRHNNVAWLAKKTCIGVEPSTANSEYWFELLTTDATKLGGETAEQWQRKIDAKVSGTHTHTKSQITDFPTSMPASDVYSWAKASSKPNYTKSEVGLGNVDNTADSAKSVKYATSAGSANAVAWGNVSGKPTSFTPSSHTHAVSQITGTVAVTISSSQPSSGLWVVP